MYMFSVGRIPSMYQISSLLTYTQQSPHVGAAPGDNPQTFAWFLSLMLARGMVARNAHQIFLGCLGRAGRFKEDKRLDQGLLV